MVQTSPDTRFSFVIQGLPADLFKVLRFEGKEAISQPFRFEVTLISGNLDLDLDGALGRQACLTIEVGTHRRQVFGVMDALIHERQTPTGGALRRAVLVPRLSALTFSVQNQIYGCDESVSVLDILQAELMGKDTIGPKQETALRLSDQDVEIHLNETYPDRDYIVQFGESDLDFLHRQLEHWGIFYYFDHTGSAEKLIISDSCLHNDYLPSGNKTVPYRAPSGLARPDQLCVTDLVRHNRRLPHKVVLRDYNYRTPKRSLMAENVIDPNGQGIVTLYGEHFRNEAEGRFLAGIRADEIRCRRAVFSGKATHPGFCPGFLFTLHDHYLSSEFPEDYLLTEVHHRGSQFVPEMGGAQDSTTDAIGYRNSFVALPSTVTFRPERRTPKPRIEGLINAQVEGTDQAIRADLDGEGRYRVRTQFDLSGREKGRASRLTRKAEPYAGPHHGMHFPLVEGTEVILAHVNGDPDRPIIVGCVPNPSAPSVVNRANTGRNRIRTSSGITVDIEDGAKQEGRASQGDVRLAQARRRTSASASSPNSSPAASAAGSGAPAGSASADGADALYRLYVPTGSGASEAYLRLGAYDHTVEGRADTGAVGLFAAHALPTGTDHLTGWLDYADKGHTSLSSERYTGTLADEIADTGGRQTVRVAGDQSLQVGTEAKAANRTETVFGCRELAVKSDDSVTIEGNQTQSIKGNSKTTYSGPKIEWVEKSEVKRVYGASHSEFVGAKSDIAVSASFKLHLAVAAEVFIGFKPSFTLSKAAVTFLSIDWTETKFDKAKIKAKANDIEAGIISGVEATKKSIEASANSAVKVGKDVIDVAKHGINVDIFDFDMNL